MASWMGRSCTGRRPVQSLLLMSAAATLVTACGGVLRPEFPEVPGVREIDLQWKPKVGMHVVHVVSSALKVSTGLLPWDKQRAETRTTRAMDFVAVKPDYVEFGITGVPGSIRLSRKDLSLLRISFYDSGSVKELRFDEGGNVDLRDSVGIAKEQLGKLRAALAPVQNVFRTASKFLGRWRVGELRTVEIEFPMSSPTEKAKVLLNSSLRRVVLVNGRAAAEFTGIGRASMSFAAGKGELQLLATQWVDLLTGMTLRSSGRANGKISGQGKEASYELVSEEVLDLDASRLECPRALPQCSE